MDDKLRLMNFVQNVEQILQRRPLPKMTTRLLRRCFYQRDTAKKKIALAIMKAVRSSVVSSIGIGFEGPCNVSSSAMKDIKSCFSKRAKG